MKITFDIDCTPQEARAFLGLPDLEDLYKSMVGRLEERMTQAMEAMEPEALLRTWFPASLGGMEQIQKAFWSQFMSPGSGSEGQGEKKKG